MNPLTNEEDALFLSARQWVKHDPNLVTAQYVQERINAKDVQTLQQLFPSSSSPMEQQRIVFGTAGLRSRMAPGPFHMNDLVVIQTAQGIAQYCLSLGTTDCVRTTTTTDADTSNNTAQERNRQRLAIVIGYDHRASQQWNISSRQFALWTALVFQEAGFDNVVLLDGYVATPMIPYAVLHHYHLHHTATTTTSTAPTNVRSITYGIMITASHNPKEDAGYKIYWNDGCQIRSPIDQCIAESILNNLNPWIDYDEKMQQHKSLYTNDNDPCYGLSDPIQTQEIITAYYNALHSSGLVSTRSVANDQSTPSNHHQYQSPKFCYTAMHGVGYQYAQRAFDMLDLLPFKSVPSQQEPDCDFPTVPFPNPEEKNALKVAQHYAQLHDCDIVLANDPDVDRLAVAERIDRNGETDWIVFTGDQIGVMLGHWLWQQHCKNPPTTTTAQFTSTNHTGNDPITHRIIVPAMCVSTVSSHMLAEIAAQEGFYVEETLTGFKWIGSRAAQLHNSICIVPTPDQDGIYKVLFSYEEAIGFCCGNIIFDKDGISALVVLAKLAYDVYGRGLTLQQHMQTLYDKYGEFVSNNGYYSMEDSSVVATIMDGITNKGAFDQLDMVGPYKIASVRYLGEPGYDSLQPNHKPTLPCSKSSPMITLRFENGCIVQLRASGTEPKFKYYIELKGSPGVSRDRVSRQLATMSEFLLEALLEPAKNRLRRPSILY